MRRSIETPSQARNGWDFSGRRTVDILLRFMAIRLYERTVQTACGLSLLVLLVATEKAFPSLNAPCETARNAKKATHCPNTSSDPKKNKPADDDPVVLGPIYPDLFGRSVGESQASAPRERIGNPLRGLSPIEWSSFLDSQRGAIAAFWCLPRDAARSVRCEPPQVSANTPTFAPIRFSITRTGPPLPTQAL